MKLYVFNPDADMALGNNEENYMAPATIRRMAEDLALLPAWYAQPGSGVLAPSAYNADFLKQMQQQFRLDVKLVTEPELPDYAEAQVMPWGWNPALRKRMLKGGILERKLPTRDELHIYRKKAARSNSIAYYALFDINKIDYTCGGPCSLIETDGMPGPVSPEVISRYTDGCVLKSMWSSSGKGLCWCRHGFTKTVSNWCNRVMKTDGAFIIEPIYDKVEDFAVEFYSDGEGKVLFAGYSRFVTDEKGAYRGNILTSDKQVEEWIQQYIPLEAFIRIRSMMQKGLEPMVGMNYKGYLGVDMMVCRQQEGHPYAIYPHVEINLRMTMGVVSRMFYDNFMVSGSEGRLSIDYYPSNEALKAQHEQDMRDYPLVVEDGRIVSGYLPLVPVTPRSRYRAFVKVTAG